ncbi:Protein of unknown function [Bacillus cereus]|nr:Protein of unknown function [Bacillus cereus]
MWMLYSFLHYIRQAFAVA